MVKLKHFTLFFLVSLLIFALAACGTCNCVDSDGNGICDNCKKEVSDGEVELVLIEDGEALFQVVIAEGASSDVVRAVNTSIKSMLRNMYGIDVDVVIENSGEDSEIPVEILVGNVYNRGDEYLPNGYSLMPDDYVIKTLDTKVLINAGSDEMLDSAVRKFAETVLKNGSSDKTVMRTSNEVIKISGEHTVTSLKLNGEDMSGYTIAADLSNEVYAEAAKLLQKNFFSKTGYWFAIVDSNEASDRSIVIKHTDSDGEESFKVSVDGTHLRIDCGYDNMLDNAVTSFLDKVIFQNKDELDFKGTVYTRDISVIYYEDFGAVGDGKTDDFVAMYNAHVCANLGGQTVMGKPGATYYIFNARISNGIGFKAASIPIKTNVDWQGAKIIIDDTEIASYGGGQNYDLSATNIFSVVHDDINKGFTFKDEDALDKIVADGLNPDTTHIDLKIDGWDGALMLIPYNAAHNVFRRRGYSGHSGAEMHEVIVIEADGKVSEETPIMFDYTNLDYITVYRLDPSTAISVGNGIIETIDTKIDHSITKENGTVEYKKGYRKRGIAVSRSYTTVYKVEHIVSGGFDLYDRSQGYDGAMASGMFRASYANHVTFQDCIIPGRQSFQSHSSYNFGAVCVNKVVLERCIQSNFWVTVNTFSGTMTPHASYVDGAYPSTSTVKVNGKSLMMHWGIGGTNYCKNMEYIDSQISRFDAHAGLYNGKIINTNINGMELTGVGDLIIENVNWYQYGTTVPFLFLRSDYGYHWDGDITVKNTNAYLYDITSSKPTLYLAHHKYVNWYFGYTCAFPNITLDNFGVCSMKNQTPLEEGYEVNLFNFKSGAEQMHLSGNVTSRTLLDYIDADSDGYIDEPYYDVNLDGKLDEADRIDLDGDGRIGNTKLKIKDYKSSNYGISHPDLYRNVNVTRPPSYFKVINNTGGYVYKIVNTAERGVSDGGWHRDKNTTDTMGGFFGNTKFIYGTGEGDFFIGTDHAEQNATKTFKFISSFY